MTEVSRLQPEWIQPLKNISLHVAKDLDGGVVRTLRRFDLVMFRFW